MPLLAAAQGGLLFPPNWFYLPFSPATATNLMVVSSYMIAALGAYLYARSTRVSVFGAVVTSIIWQSCGFMIGQISHINIVHTAAMLPWVLWALERYAVSGSRRGGALLALLVAIQVFAGHQQSFAYSLMLVSAYAIVMAFAHTEARKRYLSSLIFVATGVLLGAVQIVPTFELLRNSTRATAGYSFITSFSMPKRFVLNLLAPYLMGGGDGRLFRAPYFGPPFYAELVAYISILGLMLAIVAVFLKPDTRTKFWMIVFPAGLLLAFGGYAPLHLYWVIYFVPVLNLFRVPARHLIEAEFALSVLAGRGVMALQAARGNRRAQRRVAIVGATVFLLTFFAVTWWRPADFRLDRVAPVSILRAPELFMPILIAGASAIALFMFARGRRGSATAVLVIIILDLALWGQSTDWYTASPRRQDEIWRLPEIVRVLREHAPREASSYRILTAPHTFDPAVPPVGPSVSRSTDWGLWTQPDYYMMFGIQNAAGYDGFGLARYGHLAGEMKVWGELNDPNTTLRGPSREMDLLNVRYLVSMRRTSAQPAFLPESGTTPSTALSESYGGFKFAPTDLGLPNLAAKKSLRFTLPAFAADHFALITNLSWSENISDGATIGHLRLTTQDGRVLEFELRAGVDTSEWAYDRADIHARIRHQRANVATSYEVTDAQGNYQAHTYVTSFALPEKTMITGGEIVPESRWPNLLLSVFRISLANSAENQTLALPAGWIRIGDGSTRKPQPNEENKNNRWKLIAQTPDDIYENTRTLPRVWLASDARVLNEQSMLEVIRTGRMADGSAWDPRLTALVTERLAIASGSKTQPRVMPGVEPASESASSPDASAADGRAEITRYEPNRVDVKTEASGPSILVLSENHYPGWRAYVDGRRVDVLRVDYNLRAVALAGGAHQISFVYRPWSVMIGFLVSLLTALVLALWGLRRNKFSGGKATALGT